LSQSRVGGAIIQNNHFEVWIILPQRGFDTGADIFFFVAGGDANRNQRRVGGRRCRLDNNIEMILVVNPISNANLLKSEKMA
jgi:hypothetical protein